MHTKTTAFLLATSAIIGVTSLTSTPAFAQIEDVADPGVAITTTPIFGGTDNGKNFILTTTNETIQAPGTVLIGTSTADGLNAIRATDSSAATTLTFDNTGGSSSSIVNIVTGDSTAVLQKEASQDLNINVNTASVQGFLVRVQGDVNLGNGVFSVAPNPGAGAVSATIQGIANAGVIQINSTNGNASIMLEGDVNAPVISIFHDEGSRSENVTFAGNDALSINSDIFTDSANNLPGGGVIVSGAGTHATFNGNIGTTSSANIIATPGVDSAQNLSTLNIQTNSTATLTQTSLFTGHTTLNGTLNNSGTLTIGGSIFGGGMFNNTNTATINGAISATGMFTNSGTLNVLGATSGAATIANTGTLTLNSSNAATINNAGTLNIAAPITNTGIIDLASSGTTNLGLSTITNGQTAITGGTVNLTGNTTVLLNPNLADGDSITIADMVAATTNGNLAANIANLSIGSALNQIMIDTSSGAVVVNIGPINNVTQLASTLGISVAESTKLISAATDATSGNFTAVNAAFAPFQTEIINALTGTTAEARAIAERLGDATATAGALTDASISAFNETNTNIYNRLASLRSGEAGIAAGNGAATENMWFEATASTLDQDRRKGVAGFEVDSAGGTIGYDAESGNGHIGVAFGYNYSQIDGDSAANVDSNVNTYLLTLYGDQEVGEAFINGSLHFGLNEVDTRQTSDVRRSSSYTNTQYGAAIDFGHHVQIGENAQFTPSIGLNYTHIGAETITLTDINGVNPNITDRISSKDALIGKVGAHIQNAYQTDSGSLLKAAAHANFLYDFASDEVTNIRNFGGGITVQDIQAEIAQEALNLGVAFSYESEDRRTAIGLGYDIDLKNKFIAHTGSVRFSFRF